MPREMSKAKKFKIAFIHPDLGIGGAERLILDVAGALKKQKHEVVFITNHFDKTHAFEELKNNEYPVKVYGDWLPRCIFGRFQALCAYIRMIYLSIVYVFLVHKNEKPDLYFIDLIPVAIPFLKLVNEKVIYYCHHPDLLASSPGGSLKKIYRKPIDWVEEKTTAQADIILVNSEYTASIFNKTFPNIKKPVQILYPTIAFSYQETVKKLKNQKHISDLLPKIKTKQKDLTVFLSLNRFHPAKKLELAINAMGHLKAISSKEEWEKVYFIMAGGFDPQSKINSDCYQKLTKLVNDKNLGDKFIFLKSPSDDLKADLLNSCSCLIYTPVKEHFGIVPLEAMLVSKPVIAVNSGGPRETVDHGITGYLCEPTADSMGEFMHRIINENTAEMGAKGKIRLKEKFSYESFGNCLKRIISKTLAENRGNKKQN